MYRQSNRRAGGLRRVVIALLCTPCVWLGSVTSAGVTGAAEKRLNVLFIGVDDLRPRLGCYGEPDVKSPNIDRIASEGLLFRRAYCQCASCGPSRASLLTGRRPDTTGVPCGNRRHFRRTLPKVVTLPQQFKRHGYHTQSLGKILHGIFKSEIHEDPPSWTVPEWRPIAVQYATAEGTALLKRLYPGRFVDPVRTVEEVMTLRRLKGLAWEAPDVPDNALIDGRIADKAVEVLREIKDRPFFLAVGFVKPHAPFVAPKKYFDLYNAEEIVLPSNSRLPLDAAGISHNDSREMRGYHGVPKNGPVPDEQARQLILAYNACTSYVDAQIGRIVEELERLHLRERTVIVLWGDHGYHLGHIGMWCKNNNYESAVRVPLIVSVPGRKPTAATTDALVELVDLYPTLCDICSVPLTEGLEGVSFEPLFDQPSRPWKTAVFSQHGPPNDPKRTLGRGIRTDRYRLIELTRRDKKPVRELYRYDNDGLETANLADRPRYAELVRQLAERLHAGWKGETPPTQ